MKSIYYTASTLNGYIATPDHSLDWLMQFAMPGDSYEKFIADVGAIAMGANTFQWMIDHHLFPKNSAAQPWLYTQPTWIFTHRDRQSFPRIENAAIQFVRGDVRAVHREMVAAAGGKNVWLAGGGELAGQFLDHGLLDELIIQIAPVTLAAGTPLLPRTVAIPPLRLLASRVLSETFVEVHYEVVRKRRVDTHGE